MQLVLICYIEDEAKRKFPDAPWQACVRWGPMVWAKNRRTAIRRAIQAYLQERSSDPVGNLTVNIARRDFDVRDVAFPESIAYLNRMKG